MDGPPKKGGALQHAPIPKFQTLAQRRYAACAHESTRLQLMPPGHIHHGAEVCTNCDRVLRWIPKPETVVRRRYNVYRLVKLAMCDGLTDWERSFVASVSKLRRFSPRQQQIIDELCSRYLEEVGS
jgi:hypothetical protein